MRESELRAVVEAVVRVLSDKGLLKSDCGCGPEKPAAAKPGASRKVEVTVGTAGKVFTPSWTSPTAKVNPPRALPQAGIAAKVSAKADDGDSDCTSAPGCPHCDPLSKCSESQLRALGADRIAVCHPTQGCSPVAKLVDHTLLKPNATQEEVAKLCEEARAYCFASVCVNPSYVALSAKLLDGSGVKVCTVIGFPLGSTTPTVKAIEARDAIANGAGEIDMVINIGALKSGNDEVVYNDIEAVREATRGRVLKVILETSLLTKEEKVRACLLSKKAGADFVKTSTGFGGGGATVEDIRLMRETVGPLLGVKASGGIRDKATADAMIAAGATRLGTSASIAIVSPEKAGKSEGGKY
ncbi:MAG: deoxyribose-phosphate aldolase [Elusimicrobia bacterium]|nr:deoxyribose-phosphate aldolase [Elusimicrobiota bacterium]